MAAILAFSENDNFLIIIAGFCAFPACGSRDKPLSYELLCFLCLQSPHYSSGIPHRPFLRSSAFSLAVVRWKPSRMRNSSILAAGVAECATRCSEILTALRLGVFFELFDIVFRSALQIKF